MDQEPDWSVLPSTAVLDIVMTGHTTFDRDGIRVHICYNDGCPDAAGGIKLDGSA